jgi:hypothetical protein
MYLKTTSALQHTHRCCRHTSNCCTLHMLRSWHATPTLQGSTPQPDMQVMTQHGYLHHDNTTLLLNWPSMSFTNHNNDTLLLGNQDKARQQHQQSQQHPRMLPRGLYTPHAPQMGSTNASHKPLC